MPQPVTSSRVARRAAVGLATVALTACGVLGPGSHGQRSEFELRRNAWQALDIRDYDYTLQSSCFCPPDSLEPVVLSVRAGQITGAVHAATGEPVPPAPTSGYDHYYTIDELFELLDRSLSRPWRVDRVEYDPVHHYPRRIEAHVPNTVDSGFAHSARDLTPIP
jgi:hypothetical protein